MTNYILRRLLLVPLLLFGVTVIIFAMLQFISPTERAALYVRDLPRNSQQINSIIRLYGLDRPLYQQYWRWLVGTVDPRNGQRRGGIIYGDFGYSRTGSQPVIDLIRTRFPNTLDLTCGRWRRFSSWASGWESRRPSIKMELSTSSPGSSASWAPPCRYSSLACWS